MIFQCHNARLKELVKRKLHRLRRLERKFTIRLIATSWLFDVKMKSEMYRIRATLFLHPR